MQFKVCVIEKIQSRFGNSKKGEVPDFSLLGFNRAENGAARFRVS